MRNASIAFVLAVLACTSPTLAASAEPASSATPDERSEAVRGARFELGAFMLAHVRRENSLDREPGTLAPGGSLGVGWRIASWQIEALARGAHYAEPGMWSLRRTTMLAAGGRARWFTNPSSAVSPFFDFGIDVLVLAVDEATGLGPAAHAGTGIELGHDRAHHRLRLGVGLDVPAFAVTYPKASCAGEGCQWSSTDRPLYIVPLTVAATWTF